MIQALAKSDNEHFVRQSVTWEQCQSLQSAFTDIDRVRLIYCEGVLEIVGIGRLHEMIRTLLGALLLPSQCKNRQRAKGKKWID